MLVDVWGNAVYTDFGQGTENPFPAYDNGEEIYAQLFTLLDAAKENMGKEVVETIGTSDLIYGGLPEDDRIENWIKFANSLKLKLYNNVRLTDLYDAAAVEA